MVALVLAGLPAARTRAQSAYIDALLADGPLGYWQLDSNNATSLVGGYTTTYVNGATTSAPGTGRPSAIRATQLFLSMETTRLRSTSRRD